jgi:hypothetical protein
MGLPATTDEIPLPDLRKPMDLPSLPVWLDMQHAALATELQPTEKGFRDVLTLPPARMPSATQREIIEDHLNSLHSCLNQTPENDSERAKETFVTLTKMMMVLGGAKASEEAAEAKVEIYMQALEGIPSWATEAAARRWYRGNCGRDERREPYAYKFMPDPASLCRIARIEAHRVRARIKDLEEVLSAVPYVDCSADLERGRHAMNGLWKTFANGKAVKGLTFEASIQIGNNANLAGATSGEALIIS